MQWIGSGNWVILRRFHFFTGTMDAPVRVHVLCEKTILFSSSSMDEGLIKLMQTFYVFNIEYQIEAGATLEYIQR